MSKPARVESVAGGSVARVEGAAQVNRRAVILRARVSYDRPLHELFRAELSELGKQRPAVTPEELAEELDCSPHAVRSYGYDYSEVDPSAAGNGKTLRRVLRLVVAFAREGRPALLERVCGMAGYLAVPMPVGESEGESLAAIAAATREATEGPMALLEARADGLSAEERVRVAAELRQGMSALGALLLKVEREDGQG